MSTPVALKRIGCVLAVCAALAAVGVPVLPHAGDARAASVSASPGLPMAQINLGELLGDENEPDENEGGGEQAKQGSGIPLPVVLLILLVVAIAGALVGIRIRRLWLRARGWGRDMRARL